MLRAFKGTHGTCMSRATQIHQDGFLTKPGRIGNGAYFWTAITDDHLHLSTWLAIRWAERASQKWKAYAQESDPSLALVQVEVEVTKDEILNLDNPEYNLDLTQTLTEFAVEYFGLSSVFDMTNDQFNQIEKRLCALVEGFIKLVEKNRGSAIRIVFKNQQPPVNRDVLGRIVGNASCFSVRDTSCIKSMHVSAA